MHAPDLIFQQETSFAKFFQTCLPPRMTKVAVPSGVDFFQAEYYLG
jgi:hypothetical protein